MEQIFDIVKQITGVMIVFSVFLHIFFRFPVSEVFPVYGRTAYFAIGHGTIISTMETRRYRGGLFPKISEAVGNERGRRGDEAYRRAAGKPHKSGRAGGAK